MKEIVPGIYQITSTLEGITSSSVNSYLIRDYDSYAIIDTGWNNPTCIESMERQLAETGIRFNDIKKVLITHCHNDHLGIMGRFKELNQAVIYLHRNDMELTKIIYNQEHNYWLETDKFLQSHGIPTSELTPWEYTLPDPVLAPPDILLQGGEEIPVGEYVLKVIHTPGHTPGHISFFEPKRKLLFSGDVILPTTIPNAAGHIQHMTNPLHLYLNSLKMLREFEINLVLPGHESIFSQHRQRIDEIINHYRQKDATITQIFNSNNQSRTASDAAKLLGWVLKTKTVTWDQLSSTNKRFALLQTIGLLEEQVFSGKISRNHTEGKVYYSG